MQDCCEREEGPVRFRRIQVASCYDATQCIKPEARVRVDRSVQLIGFWCRASIRAMLQKVWREYQLRGVSFFVFFCLLCSA